MWTGVVRVIIGGLFLLPILFTVVYITVLAEEQNLEVDTGFYFAVFIAFLWFPAAFATGVGLLSRKHWARFSAIACLLVMPTLELIAVAMGAPLDVTGIVVEVLAVGLVGALFHNSAMRAHFDDAASEGASVSVKRRLLGLGALALIIGAIGYVADDFMAMKHDLAKSRLGAQCEADGDLDACGRYGQAQLQYASDMEELQAGFDRLEQLCEEKQNPTACRIWAGVQSHEYRWLFKNSQLMLLEGWRETVTTRCEEGDERGCFGAALRAKFLPDEDRGRVLAASERTCEAGRPFACRAWSILLEFESASEEPLRRAREKACAHGFAKECLALHEETDDIAWAEQVCERDGSSRACAMLVEAAKDDEERLGALARTACWNGHLAACQFASTDEDAPHSELAWEVYRGMGEAPEVVAALELRAMVPTDLDGLAEACDADVAPACLALGTGLTDRENAEFRPRLPLVESLDSTYGKACELGMNVACVAYAMHLLNRPMGESRQIARANDRLDVACKRGHALACWYKDEGVAVLAGDLDGLEAQAKRGCFAYAGRYTHSGPCMVLAGLWNAEIGAIPWPMSDRIAAPILRRTCELAPDARACPWYTDQLLATDDDREFFWTTDRPYYVTLYDLQADLCGKWGAKDWAEICDDMVQTGQAYPGMPMEKVEAMYAKVCENIPKARICEALKALNSPRDAGTVPGEE